MRIRTVTVFVTLAPEYEDPRSAWEPLFRQASETITVAKAALEAKGYEVQTTRIATNPFPEFTRHDSVENACIVLDDICSDLGKQLSFMACFSPEHFNSIDSIQAL